MKHTVHVYLVVNILDNKIDKICLSRREVDQYLSLCKRMIPERDITTSYDVMIKTVEFDIPQLS